MNEEKERRRNFFEYIREEGLVSDEVNFFWNSVDGSIDFSDRQGWLLSVEFSQTNFTETGEIEIKLNESVLGDLSDEEKRLLKKVVEEDIIQEMERDWQDWFEEEDLRSAVLNGNQEIKVYFLDRVFYLSVISIEFRVEYVGAD